MALLLWELKGAVVCVCGLLCAALGGGLPAAARRLSWGGCGGASTAVAAAARGVELPLILCIRGLVG